MTYRLLDTVVLARDLREYGLRKGDLGAVVEVYDAEAIEVEFVRAAGKTQAVMTLGTDDVRPVLDNDLVAVRSLPPAIAAASGYQARRDRRLRERSAACAFAGVGLYGSSMGERSATRGQR